MQLFHHIWQRIWPNTEGKNSPTIFDGEEISFFSSTSNWTYLNQNLKLWLEPDDSVDTRKANVDQWTFAWVGWEKKSHRDQNKMDLFHWKYHICCEKLEQCLEIRDNLWNVFEGKSCFCTEFSPHQHLPNGATLSPGRLNRHWEREHCPLAHDDGVLTAGSFIIAPFDRCYRCCRLSTTITVGTRLGSFENTAQAGKEAAVFHQRPDYYKCRQIQAWRNQHWRNKTTNGAAGWQRDKDPMRELSVQVQAKGSRTDGGFCATHWGCTRLE